MSDLLQETDLKIDLEQETKNQVGEIIVMLV